MRTRPTHVAQIRAAELARRIGTDDEPFLLDVRRPEEVRAWAIPNVVNIPLDELPGRLSEVPADAQVVLVCESGNRSSHAATLLADAGFRTGNLIGGMQAWGRVYDTATAQLKAGTLVQVRRRAKGCLSYVVGSGEEALVVDPSVDLEIYTDLARQHGWRITRVFDTHLHADHLSGARSLARITGASLHLSPFDPFDFDHEPLAEGERFVLTGGLEVSVTVLHTPGHTQGSVMFRIGDEALLSGDTLFVDSVGRPDLADRAEEFARNLYRSIADKVLALDEATQVFPAHYGETTAVVPDEPVMASLADLRRDVKVLSFDEESFVAWATGVAVARPPNYEEIVRVNMGLVDPDPETLALLEAGPNRCSL